jgi:hypothetical protein
MPSTKTTLNLNALSSLKSLAPAAVLGLALVGLGCSDEEPVKYGKVRPDVNQIDPEARGLQGADVIEAADQMAMDLLALPEVNQRERLRIVVDRIENRTTSNNFDQNIFLEEFRVKLSQNGRRQVRLIDNRDRFRDLQSRELEPTAPGQRPGPAGTQPDFSLYGVITELPQRGTSFYLARFTLTDLRTRDEVWSNSYKVRTRR